MITQWAFYTAIPTVKNGGNHTPGFTAAAKTVEAHKACLTVSKALAGVGAKALTDAEFLMRVSVVLQWVAPDNIKVLIGYLTRHETLLKRTRKLEGNFDPRNTSFFI